jgi:hypothetical protein
MREAGVSSTGSLRTHEGVVLCPPHRGIHGRTTRGPAQRREGAQSKAKAALVEDDGPVQRGQEHKHYKGQRPKGHRPCQIIYPLASGSCMSYRGGQSYVELTRIPLLRASVNRRKRLQRFLGMARKIFDFCPSDDTVGFATEKRNRSEQRLRGSSSSNGRSLEAG